MRHCIYWDYFTDLRSGGPTGYLANLELGLREIPKPVVDIVVEKRDGQVDVENAHKIVPVREEQIASHINFFSNTENFILSDMQLKNLLKGGTRSVHAHSFAHAYSVFRTFKRHEIRNIPLIFTSHCPESAGREYANRYRRDEIPAALTDRLEVAIREIEARSFRGADIWLFPSPEAMEPYFATIPEFQVWARNKDIRYVASGAAMPVVEITKEEAKSKFGLSGKKVISFMGRHNHVKGYDIFCDALLDIMKERDDIAVLVAGSEEMEIPLPKCANWLELGWFDRPGEVLKAADVFVLPNRLTYYDIVLLQAMSLKTSIIASATGGNVSVYELTGGAISLFDGTADGLKENLRRSFRDEPEFIAAKIKLSSAYEEHFTPAKFAARYADQIHNIWQDYGLMPRY